MFNSMNGYFEEINGKKYLTLVSSNGSKNRIKKYEELWNKTRDFIRSATTKSDDYNEKFRKTKLNSDNKLPLNKTVEIPVMIIVVSVIFYKNNESYPQVFLEECLYKI